MLIIGAKGFAKEVLEILHQLNTLENLVFFDDISSDLPDKLFNSFPLLKDKKEASAYFQNVDSRFTLGVGNPLLRKRLSDEFESMGGKLVSLISPMSHIGHYGNFINEGVNIMTGTILTNDIRIGRGVLINLNCTIGHDSIIGDFVELSPGVNISGNCTIGEYSVLGTNCTVLPKVTIGNNVIVAAGSVVTKDVPDNCMVAGVPAVIKKVREPIKLNN